MANHPIRRGASGRRVRPAGLSPLGVKTRVPPRPAWSNRRAWLAGCVLWLRHLCVAYRRAALRRHAVALLQARDGCDGRAGLRIWPRLSGLPPSTPSRRGAGALCGLRRGTPASCCSPTVGSMCLSQTRPRIPTPAGGCAKSATPGEARPRGAGFAACRTTGVGLGSHGSPGSRQRPRASPGNPRGVAALDESGPQQGDPFGPFLFSLAIHDVITAIRAALLRIVLLGDASDVAAAFRALRVGLAGVNLEVNTGKCTAWTLTISRTHWANSAGHRPAGEAQQALYGAAASLLLRPR